MLRLDPRTERLAARAAVVVSVLFALVAGWELFGPLPGGHLGNAAGAAVAGENMVRWRLFAAVLDYTAQRPLPAEYYTHHPYGVFLDEALAHLVFGHGFATVRLPALVMSALTPPLLFLFARALWGVVPAAVATVAFVVTPIDLAFASFHNLEGATIFFGLLFSYGTVRLLQSWRGVYLWPSALGALGACQSDWVGLVLVGSVGTFAFVRAYLLPSRAFGRVDHRQHARWFAFVTAAAVLTLMMYLALFAKAGKLADLMGSYESRKAGADAPLSSIFGQRRMMWLTWMLPKLSLVAVAVGGPLHLGRAFFRGRRFEELLPLGWLLAASFQYFVFKQGADVHVFWPHYYGVVSALGFGVLAASLIPLAVGASTRLPPARRPLAPLLVLVPLAVVFALIGRVGVTMLYQSRLTGGRFDDGGRYIAVDQDRSQFAAWAFDRARSSAIAALHRSFYPHWYIEYALHRPVQQLAGLPTPTSADDPARIALLDARNTPVAELTRVAREFSPEIVGPFWRIDRSDGPGELRALRYREEQPHGFARYFITGSDLRRTIGPEKDPLATWEWRDAVGLPGAPPDIAPENAEDARILFNAAVARGDTASVERLRPLAMKLITTPLDVAYTRGIRLVGLDVERGAATVVTLLFATASDYTPVNCDYLVRSFVEAPPPVWPSAIDYFEKEMAPPMAMHPALWKPGRLYSNRFVAMRRVGTERYEGTWTSHTGLPPTLTDGRARLPLFTLR